MAPADDGVHFEIRSHLAVTVREDQKRMSRELTPQETAERSLIKTYRKSIWNPLSPL